VYQRLSITDDKKCLSQALTILRLCEAKVY
jgi:hypothetical protein